MNGVNSVFLPLIPRFICHAVYFISKIANPYFDVVNKVQHLSLPLL